MRIGCVPYDHAKPFGVNWKVGEVVWDHPKELVGEVEEWGGGFGVSTGLGDFDWRSLSSGGWFGGGIAG